jgi:hypothetical protein
MTDYEGKVIEFLGSDGLRFALVTRQAKDKLQVVDERASMIVSLRTRLCSCIKRTLSRENFPMWLIR